MPVHRRRGS